MSAHLDGARAGSAGTRHVLVADDEPHIGRIIQMKLEQGPFRVTLANDGQEALDALRASDAGARPKVDLLLLDLMMPRLSGLDVLAAVRADPRHAALPCIIPHRRGPGAAVPAGDGARRDGLHDEAVQPQEVVRARGGAGRDLRRRGCGVSRPAEGGSAEDSSAEDGSAEDGSAGAAWAVVLAGGVGSRFWPMSTPTRPKQLLALVDEHPLLANTLARLAPMVPAARTLVLTNATLRDAVRALAPEIPAENVIAEPAPAGTCAALAWAAHVIAARAGRDAAMVCVHADWAVGDPAGFRATLARAVDAALARASLVTVGVVPTRDDPGFGYIEPGDPVEGDGPLVRRVARFVEKPTRERAARMRADGYLWNSGIFVWRAGDFLDEVDALSPEVGPSLRAAGDDIARFFADVTPVAVDVAVMERSRRVLVIPGDFGWDDIGTWGALGARPAARRRRERVERRRVRAGCASQRGARGERERGRPVRSRGPGGRRAAGADARDDARAVERSQGAA